MRRGLVPIAMMLAVACDGPAAPDAGTDAGTPARDAGPPLGPYPGVDELPEVAELPSLFESYDGTRTVANVGDWEGWRRAELRDLLSFYLYGYAPEREVTVTATPIAAEPDLLPGVRYEEHELAIGGLELRIHVSLFLPAGVAAPPVIIAPNRCGNQEISEDPRIRATTAWIGSSCGASAEESRGVRASQWPIETVAAAGIALAAFHESEIDPDDAETTFSNGVHAELVDESRDPRLRWGRLAAWAWGISRVVDWLEASGLVDPARIGVAGHSRRGKTALLAGALDDRIALVVAHQSGTGGAALTRSLEGESVEAINTFFPSWFDDVFPTFAGSELRLPVDQHMLIALSAPRLVLVTDGDDDSWADPAGARAAVTAAGEAWSLYGAPGVVTDASGLPTFEGRLAWRSRPGGHELTSADWEIFLAYVATHWGP